MAQEIETYGKLYLAKGGISLPLEQSGKWDQSGVGYVAGATSVPTTAGGAAIPMGSVTTAGWATFTNLDATNFVLIGRQDGGTFREVLKLKPGETAGPLRLALNAPYAKADAAPVLMSYAILQD